MFKKTHTPGPWLTRPGIFSGEIEVFPDLPDLHEHPGIDPVEVARVLEYGVDYANDDTDITNTTIANACLIAAAPDMLAQCKLFEQTILHYIDVDRQSGDEEGANLKTISLNILRGVVAKTEGGQ